MCKFNNLHLYNITDNSIPKVTGGNIKKFYSESLFSNCCLCIAIPEDDSFHRTIHKAKGSEFDNVMVVFKSVKDLNIFLSPSLLDNSVESEEQRIIYVALSRARNKLFISVPEVPDNIKSKLVPYFEIKNLES